MNLGILRGLVTAALIVLFVALVIWAYRPARKRQFDAAARLPLDKDGDRPE
ncbi:MAG: cbb3-type cytochrome c oxidase subunit 3 [Steroidobacteraceae bacterium]|nr:cbb3-type cytochrome c oxidase subunit 3 [Steroidobacteraceae bacterium]MDW8259112.1 cbb3-type cytochrome c oxidase subunit 3 [Gammaproteobacteria bacterium]